MNFEMIASSDTRANVPAIQDLVAEWGAKCFSADRYNNLVGRGDRFLEEVLELLQSKGYPRERIPVLVDYTYGRPVGEPEQEVGGVMLTLASYCTVAGIDMMAEAGREIERVNRPRVMAKIREKQNAKDALNFNTPLPGNAGAVAGDAWTLAQFIFEKFGDVSMSDQLTDEVVAAVRRIESAQPIDTDRPDYFREV